jgi:hypothetical protein
VVVRSIKAKRYEHLENAAATTGKTDMNMRWRKGHAVIVSYRCHLVFLPIWYLV